MAYDLKKNNDIKKITYFSYNYKGLVIKRKNKKKFDKITLVDQELIDNYINAKLDKKFKNLVVLIFEMLRTPGETEEGVGEILGEINKLKGLLENKYKYYLNILEYERFLKKISLIEKSLREKLIELRMNEYYYDETYEEKSNKSR